MLCCDISQFTIPGIIFCTAAFSAWDTWLDDEKDVVYKILTAIITIGGSRLQTQPNWD